MKRVALAAPDKFRGTATASEVASAIARAADRAGWSCDEAPMADGGEGTLDVLGGRRIQATVGNALGEPVQAEIVLRDEVAVVEMARASGLAVIGGADVNDPLNASTAGTGELIVEAAKAGANEILIGCGGSATTDGGLGCLQVLQRHSRYLRGVELKVLVDVQTSFADAARIFAPQKGATALEVELLERRLRTLAVQYERDFGVDVTNLAGSGAAGGLAGGLAAMGAEIVSGFDYLADVVELSSRIEAADVVFTGEGSFDSQSLDGKVVGGVLELSSHKSTFIIAGIVDEGLRLPSNVKAKSLVTDFGSERAFGATTSCVEQIAFEVLTRMS